ncbi:MAG: VWA domain-containing protein [Candidatus Rokuibacteriota bacterium]
MTFLSPLAFALLGLSVPLLLLYFLKVRRQPRRVSSVLLWAPALRDQQASALFQRLHFDPLLVLQVLALVLLVLALARPTIPLQGKGTDRLVLVLDVSASMKAHDVSPSRFREVQHRATALIDEAGRGAEVMVIEAASHPVVRVPFTRDVDRARRAVWDMEPRDLPNHLSEAIRTALTLVPALDSRVRVQVLTDGALDPALVREFPDPRVQWITVGVGTRNVGITQFALRKSYYGIYDYQAFISLTNFSDERLTFPLVVTIDDRTVNEQSIALEPQVKRNVIVPFSHQGGGVVRVHAGVRDDLESDNQVFGIMPAPRGLRVLLVSPGNLFLEKALRADPQVVLETRAPNEYAGGMGTYDVVVLDSTSPPKVGQGRFILVNAVPGDVPIEPLGVAEHPIVLDWDRSHPIMRFVDLSKVGVEEALRIRPVAAGRTLMESASGPLIYLIEEQQRKAVFVGFDLFKTDLPLRVAFPLILSNSLRWLHPVGLEGSDLMVTAGRPFLLTVEHGVDEATVRDPDGRTRKAEITRGALSFAQTDRVGIYALATGQREVGFAVNLLDAAESNIRPQALPATPAPAAGSATDLFVYQLELWRLLLGLAISTLLLEALLYWRRQTAGRRTLPPRSVDRWALGLRGAGVVVLLMALAQPQFTRWVDRQNVFFLLDMSDSVSLAARETGFQYAAAALKGMREDDRAGLIVFGRDPSLAEPLRLRPTLARPPAPTVSQATNIERAIQFALASFPRGEANRIVLLSDGRENAGKALAAAQAAKDVGVPIYYSPLGLTFAQEVVVEQLLLPTEIKFGEPFYAKVVVNSVKETSGRLSLYRNGEFLGSQVVRLTPGKNVLTYRQALEQAGVHVYQALVEVDGDIIEENNRAIGLTVVRGRPQVLLVDKDPSQAANLVSALRAQHIDVKLGGPDTLPTTMAALEKFDGLILSNVSSLKMTKNQMTLVRDYVRDQGGGLVVIGGDESFGLGGLYRTPLEEALPVTMEVKQKIEIPSLAVMLVIDRSGSMAMGMKDNDKVNKLEVAKEAAHLVVDLLDDRNELGVLSFDTEFVWHVQIQTAKDKRAIHREISAIKAGGGTDGYPAVREAYKALYDRDALLKHVIFLSDGQMTRGDFAALIRRMVKDKITVSGVAIGSDADLQLMADVSKWGRGRFYFTEETATVPRIFTLETQLASKASLIEQPFRPVVTNQYHEAIADIDWGKAPPLGGYVATTIKPTADQLLMTHQEDPLMAAWRYGLGRSVAFTSDAKAKWGILWLRWRDFNKFWSQTVRWALRAGARSDTTASVDRRDGRGVVTVEAIDVKGEFINFLDSQLGLINPDKTQTVVELEQVAPGRYRGSFAAREEGVYLAGLSQRKDQQLIGSQIVGTVVPYAQEYRELGPNEVLLREISELTGGGGVGDPKEAFTAHRRRSRVPTDLWPWLVGLVTLALVPEIALRRIGSVLGRLARKLGGRAQEVSGGG